MGLRRIAGKVLRELDKYSPKPLLYSFIMTKDERALFDKVIKNSKVYLEFGMGGSTFRALQKSRAQIYSVDSNPEWIKKMQEYYLIRRMERKRLLLFYADIGPTKDWGAPIDNNARELFPGYSALIFNGPIKGTIDTVFIDGRFRIACTLKTILECYPHHPPIIMIHDFWNREPYHVLLHYLTEQSRAGTLGVFTIKKDINLEAIKEDYERYKYDPA